MPIGKKYIGRDFGPLSNIFEVFARAGNYKSQAVVLLRNR
jgi:hypothetical protein